MNTNDKKIYKIPELGLTGTKTMLNAAITCLGKNDVRGKSIANEEVTEVIGYISQDYEYGDDIFETSLKAKSEKQSMCKKQQAIKELTVAATALIEKYNSVIQDREWVAMQAVARVNGFTYRGPWLAQEVEALAKLIVANKTQEDTTCHDRPTDSRPVADAQSGI